MNLIKHPNLIKFHASFITKDKLWIVMPFYSGGSFKDILALPKYKSGIKDENDLAYILRETL